MEKQHLSFSALESPSAFGFSAERPMELMSLSYERPWYTQDETSGHTHTTAMLFQTNPVGRGDHHHIAGFSTSEAKQSWLRVLGHFWSFVEVLPPQGETECTK